MPAGDNVYRIHWRPGTDWLLGICHCGAEQTGEDPVALWDWLLAHPVGHGTRARGGHTREEPAHIRVTT
jgi:hypothetical protein